MSSSPIVATTGSAPSPKPWALAPNALSVFYGCSQVPRLSHYFLPRILANQQHVLYLDGANQLDPLLIARFARERGCEPCEFNRLIRVARAFTCFQLTRLIERAPHFLKDSPAQSVIITALPDLYFDEDVREPEARAAFEGALAALMQPELRPLSVVVFSDATSTRSPRVTFFRRLVAQADRVVKVSPDAEGKLSFTAEKAAPQLLP